MQFWCRSVICTGLVHQDFVKLPVQHILESAGCHTHNVCCHDASTRWRGLQSTQTWFSLRSSTATALQQPKKLTVRLGVAKRGRLPRKLLCPSWGPAIMPCMTAEIFCRRPQADAIPDVVASQLRSAAAGCGVAPSWRTVEVQAMHLQARSCLTIVI